MLKSIYIKNFALIDTLKIEFDNGFSVMTGETGAGKSIILGALSLILGQRAEISQIKQNETKCIIEGVFDISDYSLQMLFDKNDWQFDGDECILRREIWANGRSRAFLNDSPVYLSDLKTLGSHLIDVHSQHQNLALNDNQFQLDVVDMLARTVDLRNEYGETYSDFIETKKKLNQLKESAQKSKEEEDYIRFQYTQLSDANLQADEQQALETELETATHAEEIKTALFSISSILSQEETGVENLLKSVLQSAQSIVSVFPKAEELAVRIESAYLDMKDVRVEAEKLCESIDFNPEKQRLIDERLSVIYDLQKKHTADSVDILLKIQSDLERQLQQIESFDDKIALLEKSVEEKRRKVHNKALALSRKRKSAVPIIEKGLSDKLTFLGMPNARFKCNFTEKNPDHTGIERIEFLFSANKNIDLQPLAQIASGGEISRVMLCIKSMIVGAMELPTIIFDEIDTGTSGEIAEKIGIIMQQMSCHMQVIAITHLPQIAAKGNAHFVVYKEENELDTVTLMRKLSSEERIAEIARMLSGAEITPQAVENAKIMLCV